jgi:hypothetical protein
MSCLGIERENLNGLAKLDDELPTGTAGRSERMGADGKRSKAEMTSGHGATRSAQIVIPKEAFSTLQPEKISPDSVSTAAPT